VSEEMPGRQAYLIILLVLLLLLFALFIFAGRRLIEKLFLGGG